MTPPARRNDPDRKAARDAEARRNYEAAKEAQRRADEAKRKAEEAKRKKEGK